MLTRFVTRATFVSDTNFVSWTPKMFLKIFRNISCVCAALNNVAAFCHGRATSQDGNVSTRCPRCPGLTCQGNIRPMGLHGPLTWRLEGRAEAGKPTTHLWQGGIRQLSVYLRVKVNARGLVSSFTIFYSIRDAEVGWRSRTKEAATEGVNLPGRGVGGIPIWKGLGCSSGIFVLTPKRY